MFKVGRMDCASISPWESDSRKNAVHILVRLSAPHTQRFGYSAEFFHCLK